MNKFIKLTIVFILNTLVYCDDIFEQDLGQKMNIGLSYEGYDSVKLKCISNKIHVFITTRDNFSGVIYTRGSFHEKTFPCFLDVKETNNKSFNMSFHLNQCKTKRVFIYFFVIKL